MRGFIESPMANSLAKVVSGTNTRCTHYSINRATTDDFELVGAVDEEVIEEDVVEEELIGSHLKDNRSYVLLWEHPVDTYNENAYGLPLELRKGTYSAKMKGARAKLELNRDNPQRFSLPEPK